MTKSLRGAGLFLFCLIFSPSLFLTPPLRALDFGLALVQEAKTSNEVSALQNGENAFSYTLAAYPWFSSPLGKNKSLSLYLSGSIDFSSAADFEGEGTPRDPPALGRLERSELTWTASPSFYARLGRQRFADPAGLVAGGLFDGFSAGFSAGGNRFSSGIWYTGLLPKDAADIVMTRRDLAEYRRPMGEEYFASRRVLGFFEWEKPDLGARSGLALGVLGQLDVNGDSDRLHSQYLSGRYRLRLPHGFGVQADGVLGLGEDPEAKVFFAGGLELGWALPWGMEDLLELGGLYSSPSRGRLGPFIPVNSMAHGEVFGTVLTGVSALRGAYTLRPRGGLSVRGEASYFIRTDGVSFQDNREPEKLTGDGYMLGMEWYGTVLWAPLPDLALTLGGGAFFPGLGNAFRDDAAIRWRAALGLILSL